MQNTDDVEKKSTTYADLIKEAGERGANTAKSFLSGLKSTYYNTLDRIDQSLELDEYTEKQVRLMDKKELQSRVLSENLETRKAIKLIDFKKQRLHGQLEYFMVRKSLADNAFDQLAYSERINLTEERLRKMSLVQEALEGKVFELNKAARDLEDEVFLERVVPVSVDLQDIFEELDLLQQESERTNEHQS